MVSPSLVFGIPDIQVMTAAAAAAAAGGFHVKRTGTFVLERHSATRSSSRRGTGGTMALGDEARTDVVIFVVVIIIIIFLVVVFIILIHILIVLQQASCSCHEGVRIMLSPKGTGTGPTTTVG